MARKKSEDEAAVKGAKAQAGAKKAKAAPKAAAKSGGEGSGGLVGKIKELREFFEQSKVELKKVTWPTRKETMVTSVAVIVLVVVMSVFLGIVDLGLSKLIQFILS